MARRSGEGVEGAARARKVGYRLRRVRRSDLPTLIRQRSGMLREIGGVSEPVLRRHLVVFGRWAQKEFRSRRLWGFLAVAPDRRPLAGGLVWLQPRNPSAGYPHLRTPYLFSIYTEPGERRRGLGSAIARALRDSARHAGFSRAELFATPAGRRIYERLGFRATDRMRWEERGPRRGHP